MTVENVLASTVNQAASDAAAALAGTSSALTLASTANTNASTALSTANTANTTAGTASSAASAAQTSANLALTNAANAQTTANTANTAAGAASSAASAAQTTANTAVTNAAAAQSTANTGVSDAAAAQGTANTAVTNAAAAQTTANTGVTNAAAAQSTANTALANAALKLSGDAVQQVSSYVTATAQGIVALPFDDTIPQSNEGDQFMSVTITPRSASNLLVVWVVANMSSSIAGPMTGAIFRDSGTDALGAVSSYANALNQMACQTFMVAVTAGSTSATTFKFRAGITTTQGLRLNGQSSARRLGGVCASSIQVIEYQA